MGPISGAGSQISIPSPAPIQAGETKRNALQAMLLKKALESQIHTGEQSANTFEGKGHVIDVRV